MNNVNSEFIMILISLIALFLTILAGFGGIVTFLWNQFGKVHQMLSEIKLEYVQKQECAENRKQCECVSRMRKLEEKFESLENEVDDFKDDVNGVHRSSRK